MLVGNTFSMCFKQMLAHANFASLVTDPKLLVIAGAFEALTCSTDMTCKIGLADHIATLSSVVRVVCFPLLGRRWSSQMAGGIQFRHQLTGKSRFFCHHLFPPAMQHSSIIVIVDKVREQMFNESSCTSQMVDTPLTSLC